MRWFRRYWSRNFLMCELVLSIVLIAMLIAVPRLTGWGTLISHAPEDRQAFYGSLASVFGGLLGFVITGVSILTAFGDSSPGLRYLRKHPVYPQVFRVFTDTSRYLATGTLASLLGLLLDRSGSSYALLFYFVCWALIINVLRTARCLWVLENITTLAVNVPDFVEPFISSRSPKDEESRG